MRRALAAASGLLRHAEPDAVADAPGCDIWITGTGNDTRKRLVLANRILVFHQLVAVGDGERPGLVDVLARGFSSPISLPTGAREAGKLIGFAFLSFNVTV